jgi:hypothetical protein
MTIEILRFYEALVRFMIESPPRFDPVSSNLTERIDTSIGNAGVTGDVAGVIFALQTVDLTFLLLKRHRSFTSRVS